MITPYELGGTFVVGLVFGGLLAEWITLERFKRLAVKRGKAEFFLDEKHRKKWRWKI